MIWNKQHQQAILDYYYCQSATTSAITRNYIVNNILYQPIKQLSEIIIRKKSRKYLIDEDIQQDMMLYCLDKVLPKLKPDKLQAAQQLIYLSLSHYYTSYVRLATTRFNVNNCTDVDDIYDNINISDIDDNRNQICNDILDAIDSKIKNEKVVNKRKTVYLLLLRDYLIDNQFDEREFKYYIMDKMNLTKPQYNSINASLGITGILFSKKINE